MSADNQTKPTGKTGVGDVVFLTGATGFLGSEIMKRVLEAHPHARLALLVRSTPRETARERVDKLLARTFSLGDAGRHAERVEVVEGDISLRGAGMDSERSARLADRVDHVIHCAATVRFDLPLEVARRDNTEGTRNILNFAERMPKLGRFDYIGTSYVAGQRRGVIREDELDVGQKFFNSYEQTKMEAETLVRAFGQRHPTAVYRPSIVVGDSRTGETTTFQGFYQALQFYRRIFSGKVIQLPLPADPNTPIDIVPVDYVVDALFGLIANDKSVGGCFHLASGPGATCTADELLHILAEFSGVPQPVYISKTMYERVVRPIVGRALFFDKRVNVAKRAEVYMPYAWSNLVFDKTRTDALLAGTGIAVPHARTYFRKLLEFQAKAVKAG
ncbi:MAG TPA: SDR family oxidoreductase [Polyangiaceae bacterium]|jgi:thioester reductase-like protein|nr:SDR family oxidoreductase [Polyangiaceae bacterium]